MNLFGKLLFLFLSILVNKNENYFNDYIKNILNIKAISIIIPVYNTEELLPDCLNSVINQTLKNIEIICIDDGSTDNSSEILKQYNKFDGRLIIVKQKNQGSGFSRNKGIDISKGKYISFLDSDDMYYNNLALESLYNQATKNKAIVCGGGMKKIMEKQNKTIANLTLFEKEGFIKYEFYQYDYDYQRFIYNKNFLRINKLYFPRYLRYQDPPFFIKTMYAAKQFYTIKNVTNIYRKNIYKKLNLKQVIDMFCGLKECLELGEKYKLYQLYNTTLNRLNMKLFLDSVSNFYKDNNLRKIILEIIKNINYEIIKKNKLNFTINNIYENIIFKNN